MSHPLLKVIELFPSEAAEPVAAPTAAAVPVAPAVQSTTLGQLIEAYKTDPDSSFHGLRYHVRVRRDRRAA